MEIISASILQALDFFLHLGDYLEAIIEFAGVWTYVILFGVIFAETGLVVTPFLPGDSLLFLVGAFAGLGFLNIWVVYFSLLIAAILGDSVNYWLGNKIGPRVFNKDNSRVFNKKYLEKTREFYAKYGAKTIIIARFVPIVRTFAPFVAGIGSMEYKTFFKYNVVGAFIWVTSLVWIGYFLGNNHIVKQNLEIAIFGIIGLSLLPMVYEFVKHRIEKRRQRSSTDYKEIKETFKKEKLN
jgi:membrane-associated protein